LKTAEVHDLDHEGQVRVENKPTSVRDLTVKKLGSSTFLMGKSWYEELGIGTT